jgi:hypothetical protein
MTATILDPARLHDLWPRPWSARELLLQEELVRLSAYIHAGYSGEGVPTTSAEVRLREVRRELRLCAMERLLESL